MLIVRILEEAAEEAAEAAAWYEAERPGLGTDFSDAVDAAIDLIEESILPLLSLTGKAGALGAIRMILKRFPYDIVTVESTGEGGTKKLSLCLALLCALAFIFALAIAGSAMT